MSDVTRLIEPCHVLLSSPGIYIRESRKPSYLLLEESEGNMLSLAKPIFDESGIELAESSSI